MYRDTFNSNIEKKESNGDQIMIHKPMNRTALLEVLLETDEVSLNVVIVRNVFQYINQRINATRRPSNK